jgi:hypothetical protein
MIYDLELTGTLGSWGSATTIITVTIERGCPDTIITPDPITNQVYDLGDAA